MTKPAIYVNRITNLSDARYCAGMGVDWLGCIIDPEDKDYVSPTAYREIMGWVSGPKRAVQINGRPASANSIVEQYAPDAVHCHVTFASQELMDVNVPLILELEFPRWDEFRDAIAAVGPRTLFLILTNLPDSAKALDKIQTDRTGLNIFLSMDGTGNQVNDFLKAGSVKGLVLQGEPELQPGLKDYDRLATILEALEA